MNDAHILYYTRPSRRWTDALPLGNGSLGAMVYGGTERETLSLNLDTLWSGRPHYEENPKASAAFEQVRRQIFDESRLAAVTEKIEGEMQGYDSESYMPLGDLTISAPVVPPKNIADYSRKLDLRTAVQTVCYTRDGAAYSEEWFIPYAEKVLVGRIRCSEPIDLQIRLDSALEHSVRCADRFLILDGQCPSGMAKGRAYFLPNGEDPLDQGMLFRTALRVQNADGNGKEDRKSRKE